mgnify:CR=1 FL=1
MGSIGDKGEELAVKFLKKKGYKIIKRNYRTPTGEIDIIAKDGDKLVFVEVKTRTDSLFGHPVEAVDYRKQRKIKTAALHYLATQKKEMPARFDIISIRIGPDGKTIEHLKDAFEGP